MGEIAKVSFGLTRWGFHFERLRKATLAVVLNDAGTLPQRDFLLRPVFAGSLIGCRRQSQIIDVGDVLSDITAADVPTVDAVFKMRLCGGHHTPFVYKNDPATADGAEYLR